MLTAVVLTHNEEKNIEKCLNTLEFCDNILVIDDHSTDSTVFLAKKTKAKVVTRALDGDFAAQRNFALSQVDAGWVLFVDADEVVSEELAKEIVSNISKETPVQAFYINRYDYMWGHLFLHGDTGFSRFIRLAKVGAGQWKQPVHEQWSISGWTEELNSPLLHYPHPTLYEFLSELNDYSTIRAQHFFKVGKKTNLAEILLGPPWRFFENYFLKLGFLDGTAGFIHAMCMAFYMFLVAGKLWLLSHSRS